MVDKQLCPDCPPDTRMTRRGSRVEAAVLWWRDTWWWSLEMMPPDSRSHTSAPVLAMHLSLNISRNFFVNKKLFYLELIIMFVRVDQETNVLINMDEWIENKWTEQQHPWSQSWWRPWWWWIDVENWYYWGYDAGNNVEETIFYCCQVYEACSIIENQTESKIF